MRAWRVLVLLLISASVQAQTPGLEALPSVPDTEEEPRPLWQPLAVAGGGAALVGIGFLFHFASNGHIDKFADEVYEQCPAGCYETAGGGPGTVLPASTLDLRDRGHLERKFAIGSWIVGGAALAGGLTWLIVSDVSAGGSPSEDGPTVAAGVSNDGFSAMLRGSF